MHSHLRVTLLIALLVLFCAAALDAQQGPPTGIPSGPPSGIVTGPPKTATLTVQVFNDQGTLLTSQALVTVRSLVTGALFQSLTQHQSDAIFDKLDPGVYDVEVSAAGYTTASQRFELSIVGDRITVMLKRSGDIPIVSAPSLESIPKPARKDAARGVEELMTGQFGPSEKHLRKAFSKAPGNAELNYLLAALYIQKKDLPQARKALETAVTADPQHVRALTAMGRVLVQQKDYAGAVPYLEKAAALDPEAWTVHSLLSNLYLRQGAFSKAEEQARDALRTGKGAGTSARIPLAQSLAYLGRVPEAIEELDTFLREAPGSPAAADVQRVRATLQKAVAQGGAVVPAMVQTSPALPAAATPQVELAGPGWAPPSVDDVKPPVANGVACPAAQVIDGASANLRELVSSLGRFEAKEQVVQEELDELGTPSGRDSNRFSYVAEISEPAGRVPRVTEYRLTPTQRLDFAGGIETSGLPALVFVFHPAHRDSFALTCEGLGEWQGQATWLVYFRQREDRPSRLLGYRPNANVPSVPVDLKGRAWIAAETFRVVHIEAESIHPVPAVQLFSQKAIVEYGPVVFSDKHVELWLPKKAELYFHFGGHRYHRTHVFEDFKLFSVDSTQKVVAPK